MRTSIPGLWVLGLMTIGTCSWGCASVAENPRGARDLITAQEIQAVSVNNAYELVERLRPLWLRSRGGRSTRLETEIVVYANGSLLGGIDDLRTLPIDIVESVRALDAAEAGLLPGLGSRHVERAILVVLRSTSDPG